MLSSAMNRARGARKNESGFTLIELLIVIVILGILAGIVVFSVRGITDRGEKSACNANLKTVQTASEAYYAKNGSYAADGAALVSGGFLQSDPTALTDAKTKVTYTTGTPPTITGGTSC
ncbi:competence type IV pilus major pilin ComGC [Marmoricola sp. RAF53]|uniref:competence type IV pilus major pilin ComGC n=1 Tax=Marmoricola sp. RAF53 TaxID=3233059 RepID=UPI003F98EBD6